MFSCNEAKKTIKKLINSKTEDFSKLTEDQKIEAISKLIIEKNIEEEESRKMAIEILDYEAKKAEQRETFTEDKSIEIKEEDAISKTELTQDEIRELNKPYSKLDGMEDDVKDYLTAKNKFSYLEQNSFEIGKSLMSMSSNAFSGIASSFILNITKKIGSDIIMSKENVGKHVEELKYDLLKKMFPKQKVLDQTALEDLLKRDSGENKKIEKLKNQYNSICNKFEEFKKLTEQKESAELVIKNFEEGKDGKENIKRTKEQEKVYKNLDNNELLNEINKENVALVLSILEKKRFKEETLERFWKNYGTIAKTITIGSFGVLASTLALPAVAAAAVATMTFAGAYTGGATAWKNFREVKKDISKNGNRIAFDSEELRNETDLEKLKISLKNKIDQTKKINNESAVIGLAAGVLAIGAGFGIKSILGSINNNIENISTNKTSNENYLNTYAFKPQSETVKEYIPKFTPGKVSDSEWINTRTELMNNYGMSKEKAETLVRAFNRGEIKSINPYQDVSDKGLNISKEWLNGKHINQVEKNIPVEKVIEVESLPEIKGVIDYTQSDPNPLKDSLGHKLEYGVPVGEGGKAFILPDKQLPKNEYNTQLEAYNNWKKDFLNRWPEATFNEDGSVKANLKPGLAYVGKMDGILNGTSVKSSGPEIVQSNPQNIVNNVQNPVVHVGTEGGLTTKTTVEDIGGGVKKTTTIKTGTLSGKELEEYNKLNNTRERIRKMRN